MNKILTVIMIGLLSFSVFSVLAPQVKAVGLPPVGYWKFDEGAGATASDSSGNGNTGTVNGPQWIDGVVGEALKFDGANDYVFIPHSSSLDISGNEISVEFWMKLATDWDPEPGKSWIYDQIFYDKGNAYTSAMIKSTGALRFNIPFVFPYPETNKNSWDADTWYHIGEVFDGTQIRIYVNGILDKAEAVIGPVSRSPINLAIGSYCYGTSNFFNGTIDEFAIYNYARTAEQIWNDYSSAMNQPPAASFEVDPPSYVVPAKKYVGATLTFNATPSDDPDGEIVSYTWDFGDGTVRIEDVPITYHSYVEEGPYTVTLTVTDEDGATGAFSQDITIHPSEWELYIEIDYMINHEPTPEVLAYMQKYYRDNGITVTFSTGIEGISDIVPDPTPDDNAITQADFWALEAVYNDFWKFDDRAFGNVFNAKLYIKEKWVLYGTTIGIPGMEDANGLTLTFSDQGGNYILIADQFNDNQPWASTLGVTDEQIETVVLMHEMGHTIGILKLKREWVFKPFLYKYVECYDTESYSVMAPLTDLNCKAIPIRYSESYWNRRNMEYYEV